MLSQEALRQLRETPVTKNIARARINPGSPTNPLPPFVAKPTVALLKVTKEKIIPEIVTL